MNKEKLGNGQQALTQDDISALADIIKILEAEGIVR
jgi:hypothetical protein